MKKGARGLMLHPPPPPPPTVGWLTTTITRAAFGMRLALNPTNIEKAVGKENGRMVGAEDTSALW